MQQIVSFWNDMDMRRRIILLGSVGAVLFTIFLMVRLITAPSMTLLYANLESSAAGEIVAALDQRGAMYEVRGSSIYVSAQERDQLRMALASEGLPANGTQGYELLDALSGFGTTSQMFDAAYWRAKEGELARTIVTNKAVAQARVHIANTGTNPFSRSARPTASVSITATGAGVSASQASAIQYLVASAVAGLAIEDVTVIDSNGQILSGPQAAGDTPGAESRVAELRERVLRLLEARVGSGNAVVEVSVDTVTETESIRERSFDPESRVVISTDTEERTNASNQEAQGVTVASNLPDGDASEGEKTNSQSNETRERVNYEVSEIEREIQRAAGAVKRITVAVLVNGVYTEGGNGAPVFSERTGEELEALRDLVASAVGFEEERGDVITIHSMELPNTAPLGTSGERPFFDAAHLDLMALIQLAIAALVILVLGLFVIRPLLLRSPAGNSVDTLALPAADLPPVEDTPPLTGELDTPSPLPELPAAPGMPSWPAVSPSADPVSRLTEMINDRRDETVEILRNWLDEKEDA